MLAKRFILAFLVSSIVIFLEHTEAKDDRKGKFMNVFQVISFQNDPCEGSGNRNGTCYTEPECKAKGGTDGGTCASGFGICCIFTINCGEMTNENCTYFESSGATAGSCQAEICPCNDNICQLRLDFDSFVISGPSTSTTSVAKRRKNSGDITVNGLTVPVTPFTQCLTDTFSVSNPNGATPPVICGTNSGQHMYVSAGEGCNKLTFTLGRTAGVGSSITNRAWNIKVSQYSCDYTNLAPQGCTQYFFESTSDAVQTYNYNNGNGVHLADQDQEICVRRERSSCRICWTVVNDADFALAGTTTTRIRNPNQCCDYGAPSADTMKGFDCVLIPEALTPNGAGRNSVNCGNNMGLFGGTTCSARTPFQISFRSDRWEPVPEAKTGGVNANRGFQLVYIMDSTNCESAGVIP